MDINDRSLRSIAIAHTCAKTTSTSFMLKCPGSISFTQGFNTNLANDRLVFGGTAWGTNVVSGDYLKIDCVDHDNVLGLGVDYVLKAFYETSSISKYPDTATITTGLYLHPTALTQMVYDIPSRLYGGTWLRFTYVSVGVDTDPKIFINLNWFKQNT